MKICTVVGARPQFVKAAVVSHELRKKHQEILIHTGQHFDYNMSEKFFEELAIPKPDYNLGISGGSHAQMTSRMMIAIEEALIKEKPDWLLVYGDTNSTLAAALTAAKLYIPVCHVEAGNRVHSRTNPEEINRICTDHVSSLLLTSSESCTLELQKEGLSRNTLFVGNTMYDAFIQYCGKTVKEDIELRLLSGGIASVPNNYYYLTCHREENTNDDKNLIEILKAMESLEFPTIYPVHPRNRYIVCRIQNQYRFKNILFTEPVGYLESVCLVKNSEKIVTDSGGLQTEAFFAAKKCVTILNFVCWPETMVSNRNELCKPLHGEIVKKLKHQQVVDENYKPFGDGHAGKKVVEALELRSKEMENLV